MTKEDFDDILHDMAVGHETINGHDIDFIVTNSFELDWAGFNDDIEPGVYLSYRFYILGREYSYQGYMPVTLDILRGMFDE